MAISADVRRMIAVLLTLLVLGVAASLWRGDSLGTTVGYAVVGLACAGVVYACYFWARRKR